MSWQSIADVEQWLSTRSDRALIERAFNLHTFTLSAVYPKDYAAAPEWSTAVALTPAGEAFVGLDPTTGDSFSKSDLMLAMLSCLYYQDLLIDVAGTDWETLERVVGVEMATARTRWPYLYGRLLYDRFNDTASSDRTDHLEADDVAGLLRDTPQGVFQVGELVSGPFGLLRSCERRLAPPTLWLPLWHCSDTGCSALHSVRLRPPVIPVVQAYRKLTEAADYAQGPASEWGRPFDWLHRTEGNIGGRRYYDLIALLGDAVVQEDRTALLVGALRNAAGVAIRQALASLPRHKRLAQLPPEDLAAGLDEAQQLQLLCVLKDSQLSGLLDACVLKRGIRVPPNEVRRPVVVPKLLCRKDQRVEFSSYGVRNIRESPLVELWATLWRAYNDCGAIEDLAWRLGCKDTAQARSALMEYLGRADLATSIRELVLSTRPVALVVLRELDLEAVEGAIDDAFVSRMLWKLGFNQARFDDSYQRFRTRMSHFREVVLRVGDAESEDGREVIRSSGVNLFVSVEEFLEQLISYLTWLLDTDHFVGTQFRYDSGSALRNVVRTLGERITRGEQGFAWSLGGGNALGALGVYLNSMTEWLRLLPELDSEQLLRPKGDLPHFADDEDKVFPFRHVKLWADCDSGELRELSAKVDAVVRQLNKSEFASIRNGLDHQRDAKAFPSSEAMLACVTRLQDAFDLADAQRLVPKAFWLRSKSNERSGSADAVLEDYQGRPLRLTGPCVIYGRRPVGYSSAVLVAPGNLLGLPNAHLVFQIREVSVYSRYWEGYPRKRFIGPSTPSAEPGVGPVRPTDVSPAEALPREAPVGEAGAGTEVGGSDF